MTNSAPSVALNPAASAAERFDAQAEVTQSALSSLIPNDELAPVIAYINGEMEEGSFNKSLSRQNVVPFPSKDKNKRGMQSVYLDEYSIVAQGDWYDRPGLLGFDSLRAMHEQTPILSAIVGLRQRQVMNFCRPQVNNSQAGFLISHVDKSAKLTPEKQNSIKLLQQFVLNGGWERDPRKRKRLKRSTLSQFMAKSVRDSLILDSAPIETEFKRDRSLGLDGFYAVDGATIRLCHEEGYEGDDEIFALQVIEGRIRSAYTFDDLIYEPRNPRTDVDAGGYGYSETEQLIKVVTYLLNTMTYNAEFFNSNSIPRGVLNLVGNYTQTDLISFKRYFNAMTKGAKNAHNLPIMVSKDSESKAIFTEIGGQLNEMAFGKWITLLSSLACAIYGCSPEEISMSSFSEGKSALSGSDTEEKLASSTDKGLRPLLSYYESLFSDYIIQAFDPELEFRFVGLDQEDEKSRQESEKLVMTWGEGRAKLGLDPIKGPLNEMPMNASFIPAWQAETGIGQPDDQGEDFGQPPQDDAAPQEAADAEEPGADNGDGAVSPMASNPGGDYGDQDDTADFGKAFGMADIYTVVP